MTRRLFKGKLVAHSFTTDNRNVSSLKYLSSYAPSLQQQIAKLLEQDRLTAYLLQKYPTVNKVSNDTGLRDYVMALKNQYLKKSQPLSKIIFDKKIHVVNNALGLHSFVSRVQGGKLKSKNEIRISTLFKNAPLEFLNMIVVHELAHLKEKNHTKAFYQLCQHMLPDYHQIEFDVRVYLTHLEKKGEVYKS
ncbi:MAG: putative metal-dependent hydrolase [Glaciecola sp.]|jgi:predicted metal-dependent hydrolase